MIRFVVFIRPYAIYLLALWIIAIITMSSIPGIPTLKLHTDRSDIRLDYLIHFIEYGVLTFLAFLSFGSKDFRINARKVIVIILLAIMFAFADEYHQRYIPGRTFNPKDLISNISGIAGATVFYLYVAYLVTKKKD
ncbi:MAG TPA: VanZ family protein [Bacteroidales bacterium]|nr:VanZ family protein [Bacteroidales bacterium]